MADKPAPGPPDLTPLFVLLLIIIIAGLGSIRSCNPIGPGPSCVLPPPSQHPTPLDPPVTSLREFTVLVGKFPTNAEACLRAEALREKNINNFILQSDGQWLVCVGRFISAERARNMVKILKEYGVSNPMVLPPGRN
jgi:hypothetical protein